MRCSAITQDGARCKNDATTNTSFCWSHDPKYSAERKRRGARGGKAKGAGSVSVIMRKIESTIDDVLEDRLDRGKGAVAFQGFNCLLKAYDVDRKLREVNELLERIERLEERADQGYARTGGRRNW